MHNKFYTRCQQQVFCSVAQSKKMSNNVDLDIDSRFNAKRYMVESSSEETFKIIPALHNDTGDSYSACILQNPTNPTTPLKDFYLFVTQASEDRYLTDFFVQFLLRKLILCPKFKNVEKNELLMMVFGEKVLKDSSQTGKEEKALFEKLFKLRQNLEGGKNSKEEIIKMETEKYPKFDFRNPLNLDPQIYQKFLRDNLYESKIFHSKDNLEENIQYLNEKLKGELQVTQMMQRIASFKKFRHETLIMVKKCQKQRLFLEDLCINMRIMDEKNPSISTMQFAQRFYLALKQFHQDFGHHYMCLSPNCIYYEQENKTIQFNLLRLAFQVLGIAAIPKNLSNLKDQLLRFPVQFWKSRERLKRKTQSIFKSQQTMMWEYLVFVDYFEKRGKGFFTDAVNIADIHQRQEDFQNIVNDHAEGQFFGETVASIIGFFREKGQTQWISESQRPPLEGLQSYFATKQKQGSLERSSRY